MIMQRDDWQHDQMPAQIRRHTETLAALGIRYEDDPRSVREKHHRYRGPSYVTSGSASSLVDPGATTTGRRVGAAGLGN